MRGNQPADDVSYSDNARFDTSLTILSTDHRTIAEIQRKIVKQSKRDAISRYFRSKNDKETIAGWKLELDRILQIFQTELAMNTHITVANTNAMVSDMHRNMLKKQGETDGQSLSVSLASFLFIVECPLIIIQTQTRSGTFTKIAPTILHLYLAYPENPHPHHQGPALDAMN